MPARYTASRAAPAPRSRAAAASPFQRMTRGSASRGAVAPSPARLVVPSRGPSGGRISVPSRSGASTPGYSSNSSPGTPRPRVVVPSRPGEEAYPPEPYQPAPGEAEEAQAYAYAQGPQAYYSQGPEPYYSQGPEPYYQDEQPYQDDGGGYDPDEPCYPDPCEGDAADLGADLALYDDAGAHFADDGVTKEIKVSTLKIRHDDNYLTGVYKIPTTDGDLVLVARVPLYPIRRMLARELSARQTGAGGVGVGFSFASIVKSGEKLARSIATSKVAKQISKIVNTPAGQSVIDWATHLVPGLGVTVDAARAGYNLIKKARSGDPVAVRKVAYIAELAADGDPKAMKAAEAMRKMNAMLAQAGPRADAEISGWLWNVPYRSVLQEKFSADKSPRNILRFLISKGH